MAVTAISCAWVLGIFIGSIFPLPLYLICVGMVPIPFIFVSKISRKFLILLAICLVTFFGASAFYQTQSPEVIPPPASDGQDVEIKGTIDNPPEVRENTTHIELTMQEIKIGSQWQTVHSRILLFVPRYPEYQFGYVLWVKGKLEKPAEFSDFDYQAYLERQGIFQTMLNPQIKVLEPGSSSGILVWIYDFRKHLSQNLASALPEPQASLAQGIVLGIRSNIPDTLKTDLSVTGTAHLLAISGINLSIIAGILVSLGLWLFGRRHYIYVWLVLLIIWFYALLTGLQAPVIRSTIMASVYLLAELLGRQKNAWVALTLSAAVMVGLSPAILRDISFQLSFLAMFGVLFIAPPLQNLSRQAVSHFLSEEGMPARTLVMIADSFCITLGAIVAVWPVIALNFKIVSFVGPVSTFLIAPAMSMIIVLGVITALVGLVSAPLAQIIGWATWLFLSYMLWMVNFFASLPWASINTTAVNIRLVWAYYSFLGLACLAKVYFKKITRSIPGLIFFLKTTFDKAATGWAAAPKRWVIIPLLILLFLTSFTAATMPDNDLHVSILDVGEGDSTLIVTGGQKILIDGGPGSQAAILGLSRQIPFWDRRLDLIILTHPHLDHLSGLIEILKRYQVSGVLAPDLKPDTPAYLEWINLINTRNIRYTWAESGQQIRLSDGALLEILNPSKAILVSTGEDLENNGVVSRLTLNKISFLFTADIGEEAEIRLISERADLSCTVLKVAHHGSSTSTTSKFLSIAQPQIAVISTGRENTFGHPSEDVITRLKQSSVAGKNIFRTDVSGTIEFTTNGQQLWIKTEK